MKPLTKGLYAFITMLAVLINAEAQQEMSSLNNQQSSFDSLMSLFESISSDDTMLHMHEIEMNDYPYRKPIDDKYNFFVEDIPFFERFATFKVKKGNGVLVCVYYRHSDGYSKLAFVDLISFSPNGIMYSEVKMPFIDNAMYYKEPVGFDLCDLYISGNQIKYEYLSYREDRRGKTVNRKLYKIVDNGQIIPMDFQQNGK